MLNQLSTEDCGDMVRPPRKVKKLNNNKRKSNEQREDCSLFLGLVCFDKKK